MQTYLKTEDCASLQEVHLVQLGDAYMVMYRNANTCASRMMSAEEAMVLYMEVIGAMAAGEGEEAIRERLQ